MTAAVNLENEGLRPGDLETYSPDPIAETLRGVERAAYLNISGEVRRGLVQGLRNTARWSNHLSTDAKEEEIEEVWKSGKGVRFIEAGFRENNLDHVLEMLSWRNEVTDNYPELKKEVCDGDEADWVDLAGMIIAHDTGEMVTKDLSRSDPRFHTAAGQRHKRKEAKAAYLLMDKYLSADQAGYAKKLYRRFDQRRPDDKLAMLGHTFDKGQASQNVARHVLPFNVGNSDYDIVYHIQNSQGITLDYAQKLADRLEGRLARLCLRDLLEKKIVHHFDELDMPNISVYRAAIRGKYARVFTL